MELTSFTIRLSVLLTPGLLGVFLFRSMRGRRQRHPWEILLQLYLMVVASYAVYVLCFVHSLNGINKLFQTFENKQAEIPWLAIFVTGVIACAIAVLSSIIDTNSLLPWLYRFLHISNTDGKEDIWDFFFDRKDATWVLVRDHKLDLAYYGYARAYSTNGIKREIMLYQVDVYSNKTGGNKIYETEVLYVSREFDDLTIEILPNIEAGNSSPNMLS